MSSLCAYTCPTPAPAKTESMTTASITARISLATRQYVAMGGWCWSGSLRQGGTRPPQLGQVMSRRLGSPQCRVRSRLCRIGLGKLFAKQQASRHKSTAADSVSVYGRTELSCWRHSLCLGQQSGQINKLMIWPVLNK